VIVAVMGRRFAKGLKQHNEYAIFFPRLSILFSHTLWLLLLWDSVLKRFKTYPQQACIFQVSTSIDSIYLHEEYAIFILRICLFSQAAVAVMGRRHSNSVLESV
jgi:hypothetical protein